MAKVSLTTVTNGFNVSAINDNFTQIAEQLNNKVLYRDNPSGEPNQMQNDLDMNGNNLLNIGSISADTISINGVDLNTIVAEIEADASLASSNASAALTLATTANTNANTALTTANGLNAQISTAVTQSTQAASDAATALSTANGIAATANTALSQSSIALTNANAAVTTANGIASTANTALSNSTAAVTTANASAAQVDENLVHNPRFRICQAAFGLNGVATGIANAQFSDRWFTGAIGTNVSWTVQSSSAKSNFFLGTRFGSRGGVTVSAGSIQQRLYNPPAGTYVLTWTGTATGRVFTNGGARPAYGASGISVTFDGASDYGIEFTGGTLDNVRIAQPHASNQAFPNRNDVTEFNICLGYFEAVGSQQTEDGRVELGWGVCTATNTVQGNFKVAYKFGPVQTVIFNGGGTFWRGIAANVPNLTITAMSMENPTTVSYTATSSSSSVGQVYIVQAQDGQVPAVWVRADVAPS